MRRFERKAALLLFASATPVFAQSAKAGLDHPVAIVGAEYAPSEWFGSAGILIAPPKPFRPGTSGDSSRAGLIVQIPIGW